MLKNIHTWIGSYFSYQVNKKFKEAKTTSKPAHFFYVFATTFCFLRIYSAKNYI